MFSLRQFLATNLNHLPTGFDAQLGIRQLFPIGYSGSIGILQRYVFRCTYSYSLEKSAGQWVVGADGDGRWVFAVLINSGDTNWSADLSFIFEYSNDNAGHGFNVAMNPPGWIWITGVDPWIRDNWPNVFQQSCLGHAVDSFWGAPSGDNAATANKYSGGLSVLGDAQQTIGSGSILGEEDDPDQSTGLGSVDFGLPPSAGSDFYYEEDGGGFYLHGRHDPWTGFDFALLQISGLGAGQFSGTAPDSSSLTGTIQINRGVDPRCVVVILLNNTKDTILTLMSSSAEWKSFAIQPPTTILPGTAVEWASQADNAGTKGTAQYYPSRDGAPPIPNSPEESESVTFNWDDPFIGKNSYSASVPQPYLVSYQGGDGDTAIVIFNFTEQS